MSADEVFGFDATDVARFGDDPSAGNYAAQRKEGTANGNITYNAPGGYHDDCVIALALDQRFSDSAALRNRDETL